MTVSVTEAAQTARAPRPSRQHAHNNRSADAKEARQERPYLVQLRALVVKASDEEGNTERPHTARLRELLHDRSDVSYKLKHRNALLQREAQGPNQRE